MRLRIFVIMVVAFVLQCIYLVKQQAVWWDASVYLGMAKYIFSLGNMGLWEPVRPLVWPLILGVFWKMGYSMIWVGKLITMLLSLGSIYFLYLISEKIEKGSGKFAAILFAFSAVFFSFTFRLYTEIPSVFFALLAIYFFMEKRYIHAGLFSGIAFLTKFPQGILIVVFSILLIRKYKQLALMITTFLLVTLPYFIVNYFLYKNPVIPLLWASSIVKRAGTWIFSGPWYFYIVELLKQNAFYIFAVLGFVILFKRKHKLVLLLGSLFFLYFSQHVHKEIRFAIIFLPYMAILAAIGMKKVFRKSWIFWGVLVLSIAFLFANLQPLHQPSESSANYHSFLENVSSVEHEILTMHPKINLYSPKQVIPMYYMVFDTELAQHWIDYIQENPENISYIFLDTCEGGMLCPPDDSACEKKKQELINLLSSEFNIAYRAETPGCKYWVFNR